MPLRFRFFAAVALSILLAAGTLHAQEPPKFIQEWGDAPGVSDRLDSPAGLAVDGADILVLDVSGRRVTRYTPEGDLLSAWNTPTVQNRSMDRLSGFYSLALTPGGATVVTLEGLNRVDVYSGEGTLVRSWGGGKDEDDPKAPRGAAVSSSGFIFLADSGNHRILKYKEDGSLVAQWGTLGTGDGQFNAPTGVAVSGFGHVFVVDSGNSRIQRFTEEGEYVTGWGSPGSNEGQFLNPNGITTDATGNVHVVDTGNHRVQKFSPEGFYLYKFATEGDGESIAPMGIAVDAVGNIYVTDRGRSRILKFGFPIPVNNTTWSGIKALSVETP